MHMDKQKRMREVYSKQPRRVKCKNCNKKFGDKVDLLKILLDIQFVTIVVILMVFLKIRNHFVRKYIQ